MSLVQDLLNFASLGCNLVYGLLTGMGVLAPRVVESSVPVFSYRHMMWIIIHVVLGLCCAVFSLTMSVVAFDKETGEPHWLRRARAAANIDMAFEVLIVGTVGACFHILGHSLLRIRGVAKNERRQQTVVDRWVDDWSGLDRRALGCYTVEEFIEGAMQDGAERTWTVWAVNAAIRQLMLYAAVAVLNFGLVIALCLHWAGAEAFEIPHAAPIAVTVEVCAMYALTATELVVANLKGKWKSAGRSVHRYTFDPEEFDDSYSCSFFGFFASSVASRGVLWTYLLFTFVPALAHIVAQVVMLGAARSLRDPVISGGVWAIMFAGLVDVTLSLNGFISMYEGRLGTEVADVIIAGRHRDTRSKRQGLFRFL